MLTFILIMLLIITSVGVILYALSELGVLKPLYPIMRGLKQVTGKNPVTGGVKLFLLIAVITLFSRYMICLAAYIGVLIERGPSYGDLWTTFRNAFTNSGDAVHYLRIAQQGYASTGEYAKYIVFYPLYPFLISIVRFVVRDYFIAAIIISNLSLIIACFYLYKLTCIDYETVNARLAVIFLLTYPFASFLIGAFTESLFIMLSVMIFYYMRNQKWLRAGILGLLASLTRFHGALLIIPVLYEYALANSLFTGFKFSFGWVFKIFKKIKPDFFFILLMPVGFLVYLLINRLVQGDWFAFYTHEVNPPFYQGKDWVGNNLQQHYGLSVQHFSLVIIIYKVQIIEFFVFCALIYYGIRNKVRTSYLIYMLAYLIFCYTASWLISGPRYLMGDIPFYIVLASVARNKYAQTAILALTILLLVFYSILFLQGQAIL